MTLDQLQILVNTIKSGSLRATAKKLHLTQPTLSNSIKNLEHDLGVTLLDRSGYRVKPTEAGQLIFSKAEQILFAAGELRAMAETIALGRETRLQLVIDHLCPMQKLLQVLNKFRRTCPDTKLEMDFEVLGGATEKLVQQGADLAITPNISGQPSGMDVAKIFEVALLPVVSGELARNNDSFAKLVRETPQIFVKDTASEKNPVFHGSHPDSERWLVNDHLVKKDIILGGLAWGHLEKHSIIGELKSGKLVQIKTKGLREVRIPLYLARLTTKPFGPMARSLWDTIQTGLPGK